MTEEINSILQRYVDDRDDLSEAELESLTAALRDSESLRQRLRDQLVMHELIAQKVAFDRRDFPAQVDQRLRDLKSEDQLEDQVLDMQSLAAAEWESWSDRRETQKRSFGRRLAGLALAAVIAAGLGVAAFQHFGPVAHFQAVQGDVKLIRDGMQVAVAPQQAVKNGDTFSTADGSQWTIVYPDGSQLSGRGAGQLTIVGRRWQAKEIEIARGDISADAEKQPANQPMRFKVPVGEAIVVGTELHLLVSEDAARLDVEHGKVRLLKKVAGQEERLVTTGEFATASEAGMTKSKTQWPMQAEGLVLDGRFDRAQPLLCRVSGRAENGELIPRGEAELKDRVMQLRGGAYQLAPFAADQVVERCQTANAFSIELLLREDAEDIQPETGKLLTIGPEEQTNLAIEAKPSGLFLQLAFNPQSPQKPTPIRLGALQPGAWRHLVVTYDGNRLLSYLDGRLVQSRPMQGDLANWDAGYFMLGDSWDGDGLRAWAGDIGAIAVYERAIPVHEVYRNWRHLHAAFRR